MRKADRNVRQVEPTCSGLDLEHQHMRSRWVGLTLLGFLEWWLRLDQDSDRPDAGNALIPTGTYPCAW